MRFESTIYLYLLFIIPLMFAFMAWGEWHRKRMLKKLGDKDLIKSLMPNASAKRRWIKFCILQVALAIVILMLARPQMGTKVSHEKRNGIEALICLDISNSMLCQDVAPSRLMKSKMLIENLVDHFSNDKVGLVVFAGDAFVQLPITSDYVSAKMFLNQIDPSLIQTQGTDIAGAINLACNSFTQQKNIGKAIIVITDGEDHEGGAVEAAKAARAKGYRVFILGIGNTSGAPIPLGNGEYMTDNSGNTVMTALNENMCRDLANSGQGIYIHVDNTSSAQERLNDELAKMQKGNMESVVFDEYDEQFQAFGILAIVLLILEVLVSETVNPWLKGLNFFRGKVRSTSGSSNASSFGSGVLNSKRIITILLILGAQIAVSGSNAFAQSDRSHIRSGNRDIRGGAEGAAAKAELKYRKAMTANQNNPQALYNLGCALLAQNKDSMAMEMFEKSVQIETSKQRKAMAYHNMGVILQKQQQYGLAMQQYMQALRLTPHNNETRYNYVLCKRLKKDDDKNNNGGGNNNNKDQNKDKKDQNKDQKKDQNKDDKQDNKDKKDQQQPQNDQQQMSKENAEQLLKAALQNEKTTQQRMQKAMRQPNRRNLQRQW